MARADVYVWTDKAGVTNVSNLPPPEGMQVLSVTRSAPRDPARDAALREAQHQAEVRALAERVQQLQAEVEQARRDPPPTIVVPQPPMVAPPPAPYVIVVSPQPAEPPGFGCDYTWGSCGTGFWPGFYAPGVVVVRDRHFRPRHHGHWGGIGTRPTPHPPFPVRGPGGPWRK